MREFLLTRGFILPVVVTGIVPAVLVMFSRGRSRVTVTSWLLGMPMYAAGIGMLGWTTGLFRRHDGSTGRRTSEVGSRSWGLARPPAVLIRADVDGSDAVSVPVERHSATGEVTPVAHVDAAVDRRASPAEA